MIVKISGNVTSRSTGAGVAGLSIAVWHDGRAIAGAAPTNDEGVFHVEIDSAYLEGRAIAETLPLEFSVESEQGEAIDIVTGKTLLREPGSEALTVAIVVALPAPVQPPETIESLKPFLARPLSKRLSDRLRGRGIASLDDIRSAGGMGRIQDLARPADEASIATLDAHANLRTLSPEAATRTRLIAAGMTSVLDVARASPEALATALADDFARSEVAVLQTLAEGQVRIFGNVLTDFRVNGGNGTAVAALSSAMTAAQPCTCPECLDAASPMAYLADLISYAAGHLKLAGGLRGEYYSGTTLERIYGAPDQHKTPELARVDATIDFDWGAGSPSPMTIVNDFSVRWTGQVQPRFSETYTFHTVSDDGVRLWVNGRMLIDNWTEHGPTEDTGTIDLVANQRYDIRLEYFDASGGAVIRLLWSSPSQPREVIPGARLYAPVTARVLAEQLLQPFDRWPMTCAFVDEDVAQARICIEILRKLLSNNQTPAAWLSAAHATLLEQHGTSYSELAETLSAPLRARAALAERLGIGLHVLQPTPHRDELDELFDAGSSEAALEAIFGWRDTNHDPFDPATVPALLTWRRDLLRERWRAEDWPANPPADARPIIDPDVIRLEDITELRQPAEPARGMVPRTSWYAGDFWDERTAWVRATLGDLRTVREANGLTYLLDQLQTNVFFLGATGMEGLTAPALSDLRTRHLAGDDISQDLTNLRLRRDEFDFLSSVVERDASDAVRAWEWSDLYALIVQRIKHYVLFPAWRQEERQAGIVHGPDQFRLRPATPDADAGSWFPVTWRSTWEDRWRWERQLRERIAQDQALVRRMEDAVRATEDAWLAELRNDLLRQMPGPGRLTAKWDAFRQRYQIDPQAGACQRTTRVAQAIETLQGILFGARTGLLEEHALVCDAPHFDEEWRWIGSYATWRAAILVYLFPWTELRPTLRRKRTRPFDTLVETLRKTTPLTPERALAALADYEDYFADVCSLTAVALCRTDGLLAQQDGAAPATASRFWFERGDVLAVARGGKTGRFYASVWAQRPGWGLQGSPGQTAWEELPGLRDAVDVLGIMPFEESPGRVQAALYARSVVSGSPSISISTFDGATFGKPTTAAELPPLFRTAQYYGQIPATPPATASPWTLRPNDEAIAVDCDGDGRTEVVVFAATLENGRRRVGVFQERGGGLVLTWTGLLDAAWRAPDPDHPVTVRIATNQWPWSVWRLLVVDQASSRIGMLGGDSRTGLQVIGAANVISGAGSWTLNLSPANGMPPTFQGDLMAAPGGEVLGFEYQPTGEQYAPTRTVMHRLSAGANGLTHLGQFTLDHHLSANPLYPQNADFGTVWDRFVQTPRGTLALSTRDVFTKDHAGQNPRWIKEEWLRVLRWEQGGGLQPVRDLVFWSTELPTGTQGPIPGLTTAENPALAANVAAWNLAVDDRYITPAPPRPGAAGSPWIVVINPARSAIGVLTFTAAGLLRVGWQHEGRLDPEFSGGEGWEIDANDQITAADFDGDGQSELMFSRPSDGAVAVARVRADRSIAVSWVSRGQVPAADLDRGWPVHAAAGRMRAADLDADGQAELIATATDIDGSARIGVIHGRPRTIPAFVGVTVGMSSRFGPREVLPAERRIVPKLPDASFARRKAAIATAYSDITGSPGSPGFPNNLDHPDLIYLDEAFYFVPMEIALRLMTAGHLTATLDWLRAVHDYERPAAERDIAFLLEIDASRDAALKRTADWLRDPLNPHAIAATRRYSYGRYTRLAIVRALIKYADTEFARATAESIPRARELCFEALEQLADLEALGTTLGQQDCDRLLNEVEIGDVEWIAVWRLIREQLATIAYPERLASTLEFARERMNGNGARSTALAEVTDFIARARAEEGAILNVESAFAEHDVAMSRAAMEAVRDPGIVELLAGLHREIIWEELTWQHVPAPKVFFCLPANASLEALRRHAELNLRKIRSCRTISGLVQPFAPYAVAWRRDQASDGDGLDRRERALRQADLRPLPYRYETLIERTKELANLAGQFEEKMFAAIQSHDRAAFEELTARQALDVAEAGVRLQELEQVAADTGILGAQLQRDRSLLQRTYLDELLRAGMSQLEQKAVQALALAARHSRDAATMATAEMVASMVGSFVSLVDGQGGWGGFITAPFSGARQVSSAEAAAQSARAQWLSTVASFERREQDVRQQQRLAVAEVTAGDLRVQAARESAAIAAQELAISSLQASHAREILDFLTAKRFATADLFDWVSDVLQDVYRFFLHQATAMARQAEAQLAFERQELLPWFIRHDYWTPLPAANGAAGGDAFVTAAVVAAATSGVPADRRGLTGSARLLHDVYALDDLAFRTDSRKLQLTRVISLARLDPVAFQDLRETGMLRFATPMSLFDHDFPGHYLRLIRRVRTSVVALIPPSEGIRATLTSSGVSRVVIGNPTFDAVDLRRDPESVALSAPVNATGVFELDAQARLLAPFEGIGVDTRWELELPRAANPFDFSTIADILFTIDYTALHSNELRSRRLKEREPTTSVDRAFSFRNELADQWYDLYHPELLDTPFSVTFRTNRSDFPPNLEEPLTIAHAALYFSRLPLGPALTPFEATLQFRPDDGTGTFGGAAQVGVDGLVSTRQGNTAGWLAPASLLGGSPIGEWTLSLPDNPGVRQIFADTPPLLEDILFILTVAGTTPTWAN